MLPVLSIATLVLSAILLAFNAGKFPSSVYLGIFFLLIDLSVYGQYFIGFLTAKEWLGLMLLFPCFMALLAVSVLYLYQRSILTDHSPLIKKDLWLIIPLFIFFITGALFIFYSKSAVFLGVPALLLTYVLWSSHQLISHVKHENKTLVFPRQKLMIPWLFTLSGFLFLAAVNMLLWVLQIFYIDGSGLILVFRFLQYTLLVGFVALLLSTIFFPAVMFGLPRFSGTRKTSGKSGILAQDGTHTRPDAVIGYTLFVKQKTDSCMEKFRPYLKSQCNLAYFSKITGIPSHHLACYFKYIKKQSFTDFRNGWRIEHAKKLISKGKASGFSPNEIGFLSGFSSRFSFIRAFKKAERISIHTFLQQNVK